MRGEAVGQREAPDGIEVGARRAQQREPVAARLGERALVGEDAGVRRLGAHGRERQRAEHTDRLPARPVLGPEGHAVPVEGGRLVGNQDAVGPPGRQPPRRGLVPVEPGLGPREDQLHGVVGIGGLERDLLVVVDDVVGRRGHGAEVRAGGVRVRTGAQVVPEAAEGKELGHQRVSLSSRAFDCRIRFLHRVFSGQPVRRLGRRAHRP